MGFVYEQVKESDKELWESIGWKDWGNKKLLYSKHRRWSINRKEKAYLIGVGGFIDMPDYYDFSYNGKIIRMEIFCYGEGNVSVGMIFNWNIKHMCIPKSLWSVKDEVINLIKEAFSVIDNGVLKDKVKEINVYIECEPECVEVDYNGL